MTTARYDLEPQGQLPWPHLVATVRRRFLVSYPVDPVRLAAFLPPGAEPTVAHGRAWVSACVVWTDDMRLAGIPRPLGIGFTYLIHRTRARLRYPDGIMRESVVVLEPNLDRALPARLGRLTSGIRFLVRDITIDPTDAGWLLRMQDGPTVLFEAEVGHPTVGGLPSTSVFADEAEAEAVLLGVSHGGQWHPDQGRVRLLAETHGPWRIETAACTTSVNRFLEGLAEVEPIADHAITMVDAPHRFALRGFDVPTDAALAATGAAR